MEGLAWTPAQIGALSKYEPVMFRFIDEMLLATKLLECIMRSSFSFAEKHAIEIDNRNGDHLLADMLLRLQKHPEGFPMLVQALHDCSAFTIAKYLECFLERSENG